MAEVRGKSILIGKEPGIGRLLIAIVGSGIKLTLGEPGSVPASVSRCKVLENIGHVKLDIDNKGNITLVNMKSQNVTFVNGSQIISKRITPDSLVELGQDKYKIDVALILRELAKVDTSKPGENVALGTQHPKTFDITYLEKVWRDMHDKIFAIKKRAQRQALLSRLPMFFTMIGGVISSVAFLLGWGNEVKALCIILTIIAVIIMLYTFIKYKNDDSIKEQERILEDFQDKYLCPNPECRKYLGNISYKLLKRQYNMHCPYCKCQYTENK